MSNVADRLAGSSELALRRHGMDGQRLLNMAYAVAHAYCRRTGSGLDTRIDDLAQHLALTANRRALLYDPQKNPNSTFASYLWDIMEPSCIDYFRKKAEGHGDRRYGHDGRVDLGGDDTETWTDEQPRSDIDAMLRHERDELATEHDRILDKRKAKMSTYEDVQRLSEILDRLREIEDIYTYSRWRYAAWLLKQPVREWNGITERRIVSWQRAADKADLPLDEWMTRGLDVYAQVMEKRAA